MTLSEKIKVESTILKRVKARIKTDLESELPEYKDQFEYDDEYLEFCEKSPKNYCVRGIAQIPTHRLFFEYNAIVNSLDDIQISFQIWHTKLRGVM